LPAPFAFWQTWRNAAVERDYGTFLSDWQPDIVHVQHLQWVSARLLRMCAGIPTVLTLHDYWYICANSQLVRANARPCAGQSPRGCASCLLEARGTPGALAHPLACALAPALAWRNSYVRTCALMADIMLTPSREARDVYISAGFPAERLLAFENGLDPARLRCAPTYRAPRDHTVFGYLGGLAWQKGVHVLVEAFEGVDPQHELRIYGPLDVFPAYVEGLHRAATHPGTRFMGPVAPDTVGEVLGDLDYLVVPSLWAETFGMVVQEAQFVGVPVIASRIGALQRIRDGIDGRLFEAGDVKSLRRILRELAAHPESRQRLAAEIRRGPTICDQASALIQIYSRLCAASL